MPRRFYVYALVAVVVGVLVALWLRSRQRAAAQAAQAVAARATATSQSGDPDRALVEWRTNVPTTTPPEDRSKLWLLSMKGELDPDPTAFGVLS